jgi:hypothetical protein
MGDACSRALITIRAHDLLVSEAMDEIASYHDRD